MGIKRKLKEKAWNRAAGKMRGSMPALVNIAVNNDAAYDGLMATIKEINEKRSVKNRYIYELTIKKKA